MPISISSSPRSKVGLPAAGTVQEVSAMPIERPLALTFSAEPLDLGQVGAALGRRADDLLGSTVTPTPRRPAVYRLVLDRHIVV